MKTLRTCASIFALWLLSSALLFAQERETERFRGIQVKREVVDTTWHNPTLAGMSLGFDACGAVMAAFTPYGQIEGQFRVNIKNRFFPIVEAGLGISDHTGEESNLHYKTHSPYFRIGCDYNFLKDLRSGNRIFGGVRYGFSPFKYDLSGPSLHDAVYDIDVPFNYTGITSTAHWVEVVAGVEAKLWKIFHVGWSVRYKFRISEKNNPTGHAWYIPGYGQSSGSTLGGTFNIIFDI